ncbi:MAG: methyltransferase domain-containing protein [Deltaproteobacteria bacterium]|nr:methyltransferase domain-containing protein [Deltaproteobacteria bacterium]
MYVVNKCPICDSAEYLTIPAMIPDFIQKYVLKSKQHICEFCICNHCQLRFFKNRYNDKELERLYSNYRGEAYFQARRRYEPWYTKKLNDSNLSSEVIERRKHLLEEYLRTHTDLSQLNIVVDFGGDRGQFIPKSVGTQKYLLDVSQVSPVEGVTSIAELSDIGSSVDLIICAHVLEHIPDMYQMLCDLVGSDGFTDRTLLYIEVPAEQWEISNFLKTTFYEKNLKTLTSWSVTRIVWDFFSIVARAMFNKVMFFNVIKIHEHINFYNEKSLIELAAKCNLDVIHLGHDHSKNISTQDGNIRLLAKKKNTMQTTSDNESSAGKTKAE